MKGGWQRSLVMALLAAVVTMLTVSTALALELKVKVMPSGLSSPANIWDSKPYTWPGNNLELWGNVTYTGSAPLTYTWAFGDGTANATGTVADKSNIAVNHTYAGTGSYVATLTVSDGTTASTRPVYIDVLPQNLEIRANLAAQRALKYLYLHSNTSTFNGVTTYRWEPYGTVAGTGLAVLAFEDFGHRESNNWDEDIYAETVSRGLAYLLFYMQSYTASNSGQTDSDVNNNGLKAMCNTNDMYHHGIVMQALANTADPTRVVPNTAGTIGYNRYAGGRSYKEILADLVDYAAYAQEDRTGCSGFGGWRYSPNYCSSDNSVTQWPILGLMAAEAAPFNITAPAWVKTNLKTWITYSQGSNGGFGYDYPYSYQNVAKTGSGIIGMTYVGSSSALPSALSFIDTYWNADQGGWLYHYNVRYPYAMYAVKKGLKAAGITAVGSHDWQTEYTTWYVNNQLADGSWPYGDWISQGNNSAAVGLLVLAKGLVELPPVADAGVDQEVLQNAAVTFDGSASHHTDTAKHIAKYEWNFDYNGTTFVPNAEGITFTKSDGYPLPAGVAQKSYTVALRVTDDSVPPRVAIDTAVVKVSNGNVAPVANAGGPYMGAVGASITLDGSRSYDPNSCTTAGNPTCNGDTLTYEWDINGDGIYGDITGEKPTVNFGPSFMGTKTIGLKVTDNWGKSSAQSAQATTVAVSNVQPLCYSNVQNTYNRLTGKWTVAWKLKLQNLGNGAASSIKASMTANTIPAPSTGVTITDSSVAWAQALAGGESRLSDDVFSYTYPRTANGPDLSAITWDIELKDALGTQYIIRNIPQGANATCAP